MHGWLVLEKGDKPSIAKEIIAKLSKHWKTTGPWKMITLGRRFYELSIASFENLCLAWAMGLINLKLGVLRLSQ